MKVAIQGSSGKGKDNNVSFLIPNHYFINKTRNLIVPKSQGLY